MKAVRKVVILGFVLAAFGLGFHYLIASKYENKLKAFAVSQINKQLATEIDVKAIEFSVFKKFPSTSLELKKVVAYDAKVTIGKKDSLFYFDHVFLQFNLLDVLNQNFILREISLENGKVSIHTDKEGYDNFHILKPSNHTKSDFLVSLNKVSLKNVGVTYNNEQNNDYFDFTTSKSYLKGAFSAKEYELDFFGDFVIKNTTLPNTDWLNAKPIHLDAGIYINSESDTYNFRRGKLKLNNSLHFDITGNIVKNVAILNLEGADLNLVEAIAVLPDNFTKELKKFNSKGILNFKTAIEGPLNRPKELKITANYGLNNAELSSNKISFNELSFTGSYTNQKAGMLSFSDLKFSADNHAFEGNLALINFSKPTYKTNLKGTAPLTFLNTYLELDSVGVFSGMVNFDLAAQGKLRSLKTIDENDLLAANINGTIEVLGADIALPTITINEVAGKAKVSNNTVYVSDLVGLVNKSNIQFEGKLYNLIPFATDPKNNKLSITGKTRINEILASNWATSSSEENEPFVFPIPENIQIDVSSKIGKLVVNNVECTNISCAIKSSKNKMVANPLSFNAFGGKIEGSALFYQTRTGFTLSCKNDLNDVNIKQLFQQTNNFGQSELQDRHIKGKTNGKIHFRANLSPTMQFDTKSIFLNSDLTITNGELIEFEPLFEISNYIKEHRLINVIVKGNELEKRLHHIKFNTLRNQISIKNGLVKIPKMELNSTAFDIEATGTHSFNNEIDYEVGFYLSEVLTNKEEKGRTQVFITIKGTTENPDFDYNKIATKQSVKQSNKEEKQEVKQVLKEEFGLFKNDTSLSAPAEEIKKETFDIEWEEIEETDSQTPKEKTEPTENKSILKGLLKPKEQEDNTDDFDFDDDDF